MKLGLHRYIAGLGSTVVEALLRWAGMATYFIGDVHGCFRTLERLLARLNWTRGDRVFLTGDLVNGGPESAEVLRWARENAAGTVLGNHDLHLLAVAAGARPARKGDTFGDVLEAADREELLEWLRGRPMLIAEEGFVLVHAGLLPEWDLGLARELAGEVEARVREGRREFFAKMYGDLPARWSADLRGADRWRVAVNAMTRMRMLTEAGELEMDFKKPPEEAPAGLRPWFAVPRAAEMPRIFFGHWAALGLRVEANAVGLDSGCVWGRELTAFRLEDGAVFQERSELG